MEHSKIGKLELRKIEFLNIGILKNGQYKNRKMEKWNNGKLENGKLIPLTPHMAPMPYPPTPPPGGARRCWGAKTVSDL